MTITYTVEPIEVVVEDVETNSNVIVEVKWRHNGVDDNGVSASIANTTGLQLEEGGSFIEFEDVTKENVISWIQSQYDEVQWSLLEEQVSGSIQNQIDKASATQRVSNVLPWVSEEVPSANTSGE